QLTLREYGISGDASDIIVQCLACNSNRRMSDAFDQDAQFKCPGHHPHLRRIDHKPCAEVVKSILLGASNSWFSVSLSALSIPLATDRLAKIVEEQWATSKGCSLKRSSSSSAGCCRSSLLSYQLFRISKIRRYGKRLKPRGRV